MEGKEILETDQFLAFKLDEEVFAKYVKLAADNGWEGIMIRKDAPYEGKRSTDLLKVKKFYDREYKVKDVEMT